MCGVVGLIGAPDAAREAFLGLTTLQHRGQDGAGILTYDRDGFHRVKNLGLVESVFTRENVGSLTGNLALGHARYATIGRGEIIEVQPFLLSYPFGLGMIHNGNVVNYRELAEDLRASTQRRLLTRSDTEVLLNLFADRIARGTAEKGTPRTSDQAFEMFCAAIGEIHARVNGSYSIVTLIADQGLVAFRDPHGIRPLIWGRRRARPGEAALDSGEAHMIASESVALSFLGYGDARDLQPGEVVFIDMKGRVFSRVLTKGRAHRPCMFEWVYFASPESEIDGVPVYGSRIELGKSLAPLVRERLAPKDDDAGADLVVPVPETSRIAAIALAEELKIPYREVLIKNRYIKRTFILDSQEKRQRAVELKLSPVRSEISGRRVILVDDSIVRGTTSRMIIELVRRAGASKVIFVSTCPPIRHPCFYGIDFPSAGELLASGRSLAEIERELGADAVVYQSVEGLAQAVSREPSRPRMPCMACLDGKYPIDVAAGGGLAQLRDEDRSASAKVTS